jgi:hypothetical protein
MKILGISNATRIFSFSVDAILRVISRQNNRCRKDEDEIERVGDEKILALF